MKNIFILLLLFVATQTFSQTQNSNLYRKQWFIQNGDTLPYRILFPENFESQKAYPLLVFLHGRGESGSDNEKQLWNGSKLFLTDSFRSNHPCIVVFPQCFANNYWSNVQAVTDSTKNGKREFYFIENGEPTRAMNMLIGLIQNLQVRYKLNQNQFYAMGLSMGGMGTFEIVKRMPNTFAAAIPICGGAHPNTAKSLIKTNWWIFHGAKDDIVSPTHSEKMAEALKKAGAKVKFTLYANANHNSWDSAFAEPTLMSWLFSQKKK
jgi:predicted peptidase